MANPAADEGGDYNTQVIKEFRENQGHVGGMWAGTTLILIHHIGARSGIERVTPVACSLQPGGRLAIWAANGGSPAHPNWYYNLKAHPTITVEVGAQTFTVLAEELDDIARAELWPRLVAEWPKPAAGSPDLGAAQARTTRQFPVFILRPAGNVATKPPGLPAAVDRAAFQAELDGLRVREKAHTREGDTIAAARRRLPMVEVDASLALTGPHGPLTLLEVFEGRRQLIAYYFMWWDGHPAAEQCEGCTWVTSQVTELSYLHSRGITYAVFCQGPYEESARYRDFMGWDMPWYSAQDSLHALLPPPKQIGRMHLVCYLRDGDRVFETYWTTLRGVEAMDYSYALMDLTVYGRQEPWEDSPPGWPQPYDDHTRTNGRPIAQWPRLQAGRSDDLGTSHDGR